MGTVVMVYGGDAFDVEFAGGDGRSCGIVRCVATFRIGHPKSAKAEINRHPVWPVQSPREGNKERKSPGETSQGGL